MGLSVFKKVESSDNPPPNLGRCAPLRVAHKPIRSMFTARCARYSHDDIEVSFLCIGGYYLRYTIAYEWADECNY